MKKTILMSIKPKYAEKIMDGTKRVEYRRRIFKEDVGTILIYESASTRRVVGEVPVLGVLCDTLSAVWGKTKELGGVTAKEYYDYFEHKSKAYAIVLGTPIRYDPPRTLGYFGITHAPLSYCYVIKKVEDSDK